MGLNEKRGIVVVKSVIQNKALSSNPVYSPVGIHLNMAKLERELRGLSELLMPETAPLNLNISLCGTG